MSPTGKIVRILVGLAIIAIGVAKQSWLGAIGLLPILGGITGWCPLSKCCSGKGGCCSTKPDEKKDEPKGGGCGCAH